MFYAFRGLGWTLEAVVWLQTAVWHLKKWNLLPLHRFCFHTLVHWHTHKTTYKRHWKAPASCVKPPAFLSLSSKLPSLSKPSLTILFFENSSLQHQASYNWRNKYNRCSSDAWSGASWKSCHWGAGISSQTAFSHSSFHWGPSRCRVHSSWSTKRLLQTDLPDQAISTFNGRAVATKKKLVRPKYEECEKKNDGKSCEGRQAVRSTALLQLGVWGGAVSPPAGSGAEPRKLLKISHFPIAKLTGFGWP